MRYRQYRRRQARNHGQRHQIRAQEQADHVTAADCEAEPRADPGKRQHAGARRDAADAARRLARAEGRPRVGQDPRLPVVAVGGARRERCGRRRASAASGRLPPHLRRLRAAARLHRCVGVDARYDRRQAGEDQGRPPRRDAPPRPRTRTASSPPAQKPSGIRPRAGAGRSCGGPW